MDHYTICIKERLTKRWLEWFEDLIIRMMDNGVTILSGFLPDQAALHGLLEMIRDLNLTLILLRLYKTGEVSGDNDEYRT
jgi:hypothetical protein